MAGITGDGAAGDGARGTGDGARAAGVGVAGATCEDSSFGGDTKRSGGELMLGSQRVSVGRKGMTTGVGAF